MSDKLSDNDLVRNEQIIRDKNEGVKDSLKKYFRNDKKVTNTPLEFACECSDPNCDKHVKVSINTYEKTHKRKDRFTILTGHKTPSVEKIVEKAGEYEVVEKEELQP